MKSLMIKAAKDAGKVLMKHYGKIKFVREKNKTSYFTNVDLESEKVIISLIKKKFPKHNIISEESGNLGKKSDYIWYIDPLDGTHNYINNFPHFGVSIGLAYKGEMKLGVIDLPCFNEFYVAEKGKGALLNGKRLKVSNKKDVKRSFALTDLVYRHTPYGKIIFDKLLGKVYDIRLLGCAVSGYTMVANGIVDAYIVPYTCPWDVAAGALIVEEAGGKVTGHDGGRWNPDNRKFVASNGKIHNQLLKIIK